MEKKRIVVDGYEFMLDKEIYEKYRDSMGDTDEMAPLVITAIIKRKTKSSSVQESLNNYSKEYLENMVNQHLLDEMKNLEIL